MGLAFAEAGVQSLRYVTGGMGKIVESKPRILIQVLLLGSLFLLGSFHSTLLSPAASLRSEHPTVKTSYVPGRLVEDWEMVSTLIGQQKYYRAGLLYAELQKQLAQFGAEEPTQSFAAAWQSYLDEVAQELLAKAREPQGAHHFDIYYRFASNFPSLNQSKLSGLVDPLSDSFIHQALRATRLVVKSKHAWLANAIRYAMAKQYGTQVLPFVLGPSLSSQEDAATLRTLTVEAELSQIREDSIILGLTFASSGSQHLSTNWDRLDPLEIGMVVNESCVADASCMSRTVVDLFPVLPEFQIRGEIVPQLANRAVEFYLSASQDFESWFRARMIELEFHHRRKEHRRVVRKLLAVVGRRGWPQQAWSVARVLAESNVYERETFEALKVLSQRAPQGRQRWLLVNTLAQKSIRLDPEDATVYLPTLIEWITEEVATKRSAEPALLHAIRNSLISQYVMLDPLSVELRYGILAEISNAYPGDEGLFSAILQVLCRINAETEKILGLQALKLFLERTDSLTPPATLAACFKRLKAETNKSTEVSRTSGASAAPEVASKPKVASLAEGKEFL